jgi:outer membrane protein OmpU
MNNLKKIGLTALGTTLIASSAFAADMSVTGGASISFDQTSDKVGGSSIYMGDSINFTASGEMDSGVTVAVAYEIDGGALDDHSITFGMVNGGTLRFGGSGDGTSLSSMDDVMPNAYEESWDIVAGTPTVINGESGNNSFKYTSADMGGALVTVSFVYAAKYLDFGITDNPEMLEVLTLGYARGETEDTADKEATESTLFAKYAVGSFTLGYQIADLDHPTAGSSLSSKSMGLTYTVSENMSIGYHTHKLEKENNSAEQKSAGISASYTMGSMTIGGAKNTVDNMGNTLATDVEGYEMTLSFAF